ncbi:hypothetical protein WDW86_13155 [Bdellovibrionota bacterium FG-2]
MHKKVNTPDSSSPRGFCCAITLASALATAFIYSNAYAVEAACPPLKTGEYKKIEGNVGTPVWAHYVLYRSPDVRLEKEYAPPHEGVTVPKGTLTESYEALVNLRFLDSNGNFSETLANKYQALAQSCYDRVRPKLRGLHGEHLKIALARTRPGLPAAEESAIKINKHWFFRSDSTEWKNHPGCPLIVHETLHLLGLVDEYAETKIKILGPDTLKHLAYDCRSIGPIKSVMNNQILAYFGLGLSWFARAFRFDGRDSVLAPAQFSAIITPGGQETNSTYYACGQDAYETSSKTEGVDVQKTNRQFAPIKTGSTN